MKKNVVEGETKLVKLIKNRKSCKKSDEKFVWKCKERKKGKNAKKKNSAINNCAKIWQDGWTAKKNSLPSEPSGSTYQRNQDQT